MRLSGWRRAGIVVSVSWVLSAAIYQADQNFQSATLTAGLAYQSCLTKGADTPEVRDRCLVEERRLRQEYIKEGQIGIVILALVPVPLGWFVVYLAIEIWRWVAAGFRKSSN